VLAGRPASDGAESTLAVLVVDDDPAVRELVAGHLRDRGMVVTEADGGESALASMRRSPPDVTVLDVGLPDRSGLDVLREVRAGGTDVAVIMLTAAGDEVDRVVGLEMGADDYVVKPFSVRELEARVRAVVRRGDRAAPTRGELHVGRVTVDLDGRTVERNGAPVELTPKEFDLFAFLAANPGRAFTRDELLRKVWASSAAWQQPATVTEHVRRLRLKLEDDPSRPTLLRTVRASGYRLDPGAP
jgi:two-component system alkaline phosphatase synthesis response regulator PhoP